MSDSGQESASQGSGQPRDLMQLADQMLKSQLVEIRDALPEFQSTTSDRACVLISGSLIDLALEKLLRAKFLSSSNVTESECDFLLIKKPIPPLGSAGIRVRLAFTLGLIDRDTMNAIAYVIEKRNEYAHKLKPKPLTWKTVTTLRGLFSEDHRKRLERLEASVIEDTKKAGLPPPSEPESIEHLTRNTFGRLCLDMCLELNFQAIMVELDPVHQAMLRERTNPQSGHHPTP